MSVSVRFACNVITEPELLRSRDGKLCVGYCVAMGQRIRIQASEWVDGELTGQRGTTDTAVNHFDHSTERVVVNRRLRNAAWRDAETGGERVARVVRVGNRFGEVGSSPKYGSARLERQTAVAVTTEI